VCDGIGVARSRALGDLSKSFPHWTSYANRWLESSIGQRYLAAYQQGYMPRRPGQIAPPPLPVTHIPTPIPELKSPVSLATSATPPPTIDVTAPSEIAARLATPVPTPKPLGVSVGAGSAVVTPSPLSPTAGVPTSKRSIKSIAGNIGSHVVTGVVALLFMLILQATILAEPSSDATTATAATGPSAALSRVTIALLLILAGLAICIVIGHRRLASLEQCMTSLVQQRDETNQLLRTLTHEVNAIRTAATPRPRFIDRNGHAHAL
jgi:preprotein translocase subunit SecG